MKNRVKYCIDHGIYSKSSLIVLHLVRCFCVSVICIVVFCIPGHPWPFITRNDSNFIGSQLSKILWKKILRVKITLFAGDVVRSQNKNTHPGGEKNHSRREDHNRETWYRGLEPIYTRGGTLRCREVHVSGQHRTSQNQIRHSYSPR